MSDDTSGPAGPDRWAVRLARRYPHPVERVWQAVSEPEHLSAWFPAPVALEPRVGAEVRFGPAGPDDPGHTGVVTACEPPHVLAFTWDTDHLRVELTATADGTELVLLHTFSDRAGGASFGSGWDTCLGALRRDLAGEQAAEPDRAVGRHEALVAAFGLDAPAVDEVDADGRWRIGFERQLVLSRSDVWALVVGADRPGGAVTESVPGEVLAWDCSAAEPGDAVRLALAEGTGHGARLLVSVTGTDPAERAAARDRWRQRVEGTAAEAATRALAPPTEHPPT